MSLKSYLSYAQKCHEELPLYLFEPWFGEKEEQMNNEYSIPEVCTFLVFVPFLISFQRRDTLPFLFFIFRP